ncbi:hypothetical protein GRI89_06645 [Altererythrobacter salegens]|uniref:Guanylate cyclase domain-containing protein n=1 Tax=Croceibacterium salegens TaxID=1737568 RepID=A0A6I4STI2_9SPHN|nr:hypothetical protein [Croceibacterium salegens]MXO59215.1 hypothetical protein [Croceibacterium salegens]
MSIGEIFSNPLVVGVGTALATGAVSWQALKYREGRLEQDLAAARSQIADGRKQIDDLERSLRQAPGEATNPVAWKNQIVSRLTAITERAGVERATLYVPVDGADRQFLGLVVVATAPNDISSEAFIGTVFAGRDARAVTCFLDGTNISSDGSAFAMDGYRPSATYADCLQESATTGSGRKVGVIQLLSSSGKTIDFGAAQQIIAEEREGLVGLAAKFADDPANRLEMAGISVPQDSRRGSVLTMDISRSSQLFVDEARSAVTRKMMGELIRASVTEINAAGGVFEAFTGDGLVAAFGSGLAGSAESAVQSTLKISRFFNQLTKDYRVDLAHLNSELHLRFGISSGAVHPIVLAYGQLRTSSIIGRTPSLSRRLCDAGSREFCQMIIDKATYEELPSDTRGSFASFEMPSKTLAVETFERRL